MIYRPLGVSGIQYAITIDRRTFTLNSRISYQTWFKRLTSKENRSRSVSLIHTVSLTSAGSLWLKVINKKSKTNRDVVGLQSKLGYYILLHTTIPLLPQFSGVFSHVENRHLLFLFTCDTLLWMSFSSRIKYFRKKTSQLNIAYLKHSQSRGSDSGHFWRNRSRTFQLFRVGSDIREIRYQGIAKQNRSRWYNLSRVRVAAKFPGIAIG